MGISGFLFGLLGLYIALLPLPMAKRRAAQLGRIFAALSWSVCVWILAWNSAIELARSVALDVLADNQPALNQLTGRLLAARETDAMQAFAFGWLFLAIVGFHDRQRLADLVVGRPRNGKDNKDARSRD